MSESNISLLSRIRRLQQALSALARSVTSSTSRSSHVDTLIFQAGVDEDLTNPRFTVSMGTELLVSSKPGVNILGMVANPLPSPGLGTSLFYDADEHGTIWHLEATRANQFAIELEPVLSGGHVVGFKDAKNNTVLSWAGSLGYVGSIPGVRVPTDVLIKGAIGSDQIADQVTYISSGFQWLTPQLLAADTPVLEIYYRSGAATVNFSDYLNDFPDHFVVVTVFSETF